MVMGMPGPAAEGVDRLPLLERPGRAQLGLALLAAAEDPVVERPVRPGQDVDLPELAVGLGVEVGEDHQVDRDQRLRRAWPRDRAGWA